MCEQPDLSNPEGGSNVVDNRSNTAGSVAAGVGEQLHHGRVHPYFAHFSSHRADSRLISETMTLCTRSGKQGKAGAKGV